MNLKTERFQSMMRHGCVRLISSPLPLAVSGGVGVKLAPDTFTLTSSTDGGRRK